ncbi:MAG: alpha/beta hydrolase [Desulfobacter sp.]|nr:MAG: alpha/beta hydrolase [Desulfobacter sp.]
MDSGQRIRYKLIEGRPGAPFLVFLHEGLGCIPMWREFPEKLCRRTGCPGLVYDRNGYGGSSPLKGARTIHYLHDYALNELPRVLDALIPDRPFVLVGHSDGGSIALIYGAEQNPLLMGIITEAAHVFVEEKTIAGIREADRAFEAGRLKGLAKYHGEKTPGIFKAWSDTWRRDGFKYWNLEYLLPSITCPLLAIQGRDDQYGSPGQVDSIVENTSGPAQGIMAADCGHIPHLEQPETILKSMSRFIAGIQEG